VAEVQAAAGQDEALRRMERAAEYNRWLVERAAPHLGSRVLEVGAGVGTFTGVLAAGAREVVAVEPDAVLRARLSSAVAEHENVSVVSADAQRLDNLDGRFDTVICMNVLEHIPDDLAALRAFHDRLSPGGGLLVLVPAHPALFGSVDRTVGHERRYRKDVLRRKLLAAGFTVEELHHVNPVGALGWLVAARLLRSQHVPEGPLVAYDRLVPLLRLADRLHLPFGLSLWGVARRASP
jgi:2-polyprenyl-3-methyl-5-hydroxy-6-metoxy-1,4-benzoquinol methylase